MDTASRSYQTPEVTIESERSKGFATGQRIHYADSSSLSNRQAYSLAEQLGAGNAVFIKSYGANGLATLSLQGGSDVHSAVVWNGLNLQSTMNGTFDLSLYPTFFSDEIGIQSGSASHLWGSGAVGGSVLLNSKSRFGSGLQVKLGSEIGSYGQFRPQVKVGYGTQNWYGVVRSYYSEARNDYPVSEKNFRSDHLGHAATQQKGVLAENYFRWKWKNELVARVWLQDDRRQNPSAEERGTLYHNFRRVNLEYQRRMYHQHLTVRSAWLREEILFLHPMMKQDTRSLADVLIGEAEWQWSPTLRHHLQLGLNNTYQQASVDVYDYGTSAETKGTFQEKYAHNTPTRNRLSAFGMYKYKSLDDVFAAQFSLRKEWIAGSQIPLVPALGLELRPWKMLLLKASGSRMYRIPTFNELYWEPGGNPNILPESGWNMEVSGRLSHSIRKTTGYYELAFFDRKIDNWIRWLPNGPNWYAQNVAKVWTRGAEQKLGFIQYIGKSKIQLKASWMYVLSTNEESKLENDESIGLQLIFTPMYQGNANLSYAYSGFYAEYNHSYTGYNYIATDHSSWLEPYHLGNLIVSQTLVVKKQLKTSLVFRINNLWDANYRTIAAYPMPPRNYQVSLQFEFNSIKTQTQ